MFWLDCKQALRVATEKRTGRRAEKQPVRRLCSKENERKRRKTVACRTSGLAGSRAIHERTRDARGEKN